MRARLALESAQIKTEHREILLRDKPAAMLDVSPKGTVPVLVTNTDVLDESLDIMIWALSQNDPENWLDIPQSGHDLIARSDGDFKPLLDRYKYANRVAGADPKTDRANAGQFLRELDNMLASQSYLYGSAPRLPDMAIATFIRQFAHVDLEWFTSQTWDNLIQWLDAFKASERFQTTMEKHPVWQDKPTEG